MVPGASLLPFVPGGGGEIPDARARARRASRPTRDAVAAYAKVCGFALRDHLPPTYPHVLAFPLHMALMADGSFPFGAVGLVHVANRITQHRRLGVGEELDAAGAADEAGAAPEGPHVRRGHRGPRRRQIAWESDQHLPAPRQGLRGGRHRRRGASRSSPTDTLASAEWRLGGDLGRRYAGVSGDRNPIHMHSLTAKPLGFPAAIAHGMWTKARALAALETRLPDAFSVDVRFRRPILLPGEVEFASAATGAEIAFTVRDARKQHHRHLDGRVRPDRPAAESQDRKDKAK